MSPKEATRRRLDGPCSVWSLPGHDHLAPPDDGPVVRALGSEQAEDSPGRHSKLRLFALRVLPELTGLQADGVR